MIDNDHQGNLTAAVGLTPAEQKYTLANLLLAAIDYPEDVDLHLSRSILHIQEGLDLIPANKRLSDAAAGSKSCSFLSIIHLMRPAEAVRKCWTPYLHL